VTEKWTTEIFAKPLKPCIDGHGRYKSSRKPKNVTYSPWKWAENMKNKKFVDATWIMYRWSKLLEIAREPKTMCYSPRKMAKNIKKARFGDTCLSISVVTVVGNRPGNWKTRTIAHENGGRKHEQHEFSRSLSNHVSLVSVAIILLRNRKICAHENK
jgi:hypothetical protein